MTEQHGGGRAICDLEMLSAYRDGELRAEERRSLEEHLGHCRYCQSILRQYAEIGALVEEQTQGVAAPVLLGAELERRLAAQGRSRLAAVPRWPTAALAAAAAFLVYLTLGLFWPGQELPVAAAYPAPQATNVPVQTAIEVRFKGEVDPSAMMSAVRIVPAVPVEPAWEGNTLVLRPKEPLRPGTQYTVTIEASGSGGQSKSVVVTSFRTGDQDRATAPVTPTQRGVGVATTVTATATLTDTATGTPAAAQQCAQAPVRGFGKVYGENAGVRRGVGCSTEPERAIPMAEQSFQNGYMLWRGDTRTIYVLRKDGSWSSQPDTWWDGTPSGGGEKPPAGSHAPERGFGKVWREIAGLREELGWATAPERGLTGAVQGYERGVMLWSDARWITVLYASGSWERFADTFLEVPTMLSPTPPTTPTSPLTPTATTTPTVEPGPPATVTSTGTVTSTATATATVPTSATVAPRCTITPTRGFGTVYSTEVRVRERLGCATEEEQAIAGADEHFQGGMMYWRGDIGLIYALFADGDWLGYPDTFKEGEPTSGNELPPPGLYEPVRGFGKVWRANNHLRLKLGWAVEQEQGETGMVQAFERGLMLWSTRKHTYVLYDDGTWQRFSDTFRERN